MDEDDFKWVANEKDILLLFRQFYDNFRTKNVYFGTLSHSSVFNSYSAGIDFRRQNLTSTDVKSLSVA